MPKKLLTVKDIVESFLTNHNVELDAADMYILGLYNDLVVLPKLEYDELLYIKDKYYADVEDWCEDDE